MITCNNNNNSFTNDWPENISNTWLSKLVLEATNQVKMNNNNCLPVKIFTLSPYKTICQL